MYKCLQQKPRHWLLAFVLLWLAILSPVFVAHAVWDGQYYDPGETLNPECAPTDVNCDVNPVTNAAHGGTGLTSYTAGDLLYAASSSTLGKLSLGVDGKVLKVVGGELAWADDTAGTDFTADGEGIDLSGSVFSLVLDGDTLAKSINGLKISDTYTGQSSITEVGVLNKGTWNADVIADGYFDKTGNWEGSLSNYGIGDILDRSNHSGTQTANTISDFETAVADLLSTGNGLVVNGTAFGLVLDGDTLTKSIDGLRVSATYAGQPSITTLGTISSGVWNATAIGDAYLTKSGNWTGTFDGAEGTAYLSRANHTGTQTASTISDFSTTARGLISSTATGLTYTSGTGALSFTSGYAIPTTASATNWDTAFGWGNHASAGYAKLAGASGGQVIIGGTAANNTLVLQANSASSGNTATNTGIDFKVGDSGGTSALTITNNGNVGIGGTNSTAKLNINADGGTTGVLLRIQDTSATAGYATTGILQTYQGNVVLQAATSGKNIGFWDSAGERLTVKSGGTIGIGNTSPTHKLDIVAGALSSTQRGLSVTGTLSGTVARQIGIGGTFATSAGNTNENDGLYISLTAGNVSSAYNIAGFFVNSVAGIGTSVIGGTANYGFYGDSTSTTTGTNLGAYGQSAGGAINIGSGGNAVTAKDSGTNIGVLGLGKNTGTSGVQLGGYFGLSSTAPAFASGALMADNGSTTSPIFVARDNGSEVFRIDDGGKVGIGTTSPAYALDIYRSASNPALRIYGVSNKQMIIGGDSAGGFIGTATNDDFRFITNNGATVPITIKAGGNIGIGNTLPGSYSLRLTGTRQAASGDLAVASFENAGTSSADVLTLKQTGEAGSSESQFITFYTNAGLIGSIASNGSGVTSYNTTSDRRLKDNIAETEYGIDDVLKIPVRQYTMRQDPKGLKQTGFIAQELAAIYPDAVSANGDDGISPLDGKTPWSIDYGRLTPLLVKSIQDQQLLLGNITAKEGLEFAGTEARNENPINAFDYMTERLQQAWRPLRNIAAVRMTAIRGYFDEVFAKKSHQEEICVGSNGNETCINKAQLDSLLMNNVPASPAPEHSTPEETAPSEN